MNGKKEIKVASAQNKCKSKKRGKIIIFACLGAIVCLICLGLLFFLPKSKTSEKINPTGLICTYSPSQYSFDENSVMQIDVNIDANEFKKMMGNPEKKDLHEASAKVDGKKYGKIGLRTRGNATMAKNTDMKTYRYNLELRLDAYEDNLNYNGVESINLNFSTNYTGLLNEYISYRLMKEMGIISPECTFAFVRINGVDWGLAVAVEEVDKCFLKKNYEYTSGNLYKSVHDNDKYEDELIDYWYSFKFLKLKTNKKNPDHSTFKTMAQAFVDGKDYDKYFDIDTLLRLAAVDRVTGGFDDFTALKNNFYLYEASPGFYTVIPWDLDEAFRYGSDCENLMRIFPKKDGSDMTMDFNVFYTVMKNEKYRDQYEEYVRRVCGMINDENLKPMIDYCLSVTDEYHERDNTVIYPYDRWRKDTDGGECFIYGNIYKTACLLRDSALSQLKGETDYFKVPEEYAQYTEEQIRAIYVKPKDYELILERLAGNQLN